MPLELRLLGTFAVAVDGEPVADARWVRRQAALVVKLLALAPNHRLHQDQIMEVLWPGADPDTASNGLHKMVHLVRHALEPQLRAGNDSHFVQRHEGQLCLVAPGGVRVDADEFEALALRAVRGGDEATCREATRLYGGDLLPADRFADWASARRERLRTLHLQVLAALADRLATRGELADAIRTLQQLLAVDPVNEPAHRGLMECFARAGSRAQALRQFEHCRTVLDRELAARPDRETQALRDRILAGTTPADAHARPPAPDASPGGARAVAVLPFANLTGDPGQDYLANGLCEAIIRRLSREAQLRVMAPSTVFRYRGREVDPRTIGDELGVASVVLGRIDTAGRRFGVTVELVRAADGTLLWGERFECAPPGLADVEQAIAGAVAARLVAAGTKATAAPSTTTASPVAYEQYLRGRHEWNRRTAKALAAAQRHFERAIVADGRFALAHSGLADCHSLAALYAASAPHETMPKARAAAARALQLDPQLAEAHTSLAYVQFAYDWDFAAAEAGFARAIALSPNYATAHQWQHELFAALGRTAEQRAAIARAHALDPLSPILATEIGWGLYFAGAHDEAQRHLEGVVTSAPQFALAWLLLGLAQLHLGDDEAACQTAAHAVKLGGDAPLPLAIGAFGHVLARAGRVDEAKAQLRRLARGRGSSPAAAHGRALVHAGLGAAGAALDCLDEALAGRADRLVYAGVEPMLAPLRAEPRLQRILAALRPGVTAGAGGKKTGRRRQGGRQGRGRRQS